MRKKNLQKSFQKLSEANKLYFLCNYVYLFNYFFSCQHLRIKILFQKFHSSSSQFQISSAQQNRQVVFRNFQQLQEKLPKTAHKTVAMPNRGKKNIVIIIITNSLISKILSIRQYFQLFWLYRLYATFMLYNWTYTQRII